MKNIYVAVTSVIMSTLGPTSNPPSLPPLMLMLIHMQELLNSISLFFECVCWGIQTSSGAVPFLI